MTDLATAVVLSKSGLTSLVDRLEREGLVERRPDPGDRRATRIVMTKAGEELFREASANVRQTVRSIFNNIVSDQEAQVVSDVFGRVREQIAELESRGKTGRG
jgi:DNA-binding MarR family transcriptional regulator